MKRNTYAFLVAAALSLLCGCASHNPPPRTPDGRKLTDDYLRGRGDGVKGIYWKLQEQQRTKAAAESYQLHDITIPEHWENGVLLKPTQRVLRIND